MLQSSTTCACVWPQVFGVISINIIIHYKAKSLIGELKVRKERKALHRFNFLNVFYVVITVARNKLTPACYKMDITLSTYTLQAIIYPVFCLKLHFYPPVRKFLLNTTSNVTI